MTGLGSHTLCANERRGDRDTPITPELVTKCRARVEMLFASMTRYAYCTDSELQYLLGEYTAEGNVRKVNDILREVNSRSGGSDTTLAITSDFRLVLKQEKLGTETWKVFR